MENNRHLWLRKIFNFTNFIYTWISLKEKFSKMTKGHSLEKDLRLLLNNPKYSDIEILCENGEKLHGCRAI